MDDVIEAMRRIGPVKVRCCRAARKTSNSGFRPNWLRADPPEFLAQKETCNGYPLLQGNAYRRLFAQAETAWPQALSARADAGAAVPLQPRLRRLRQDRLSGCDPQPPHDRPGVLGRGRRVRRADGRHSRRRAADPQGDRRDRARLVERKKFVSLCTNALLLEEEARPVHALPVPVLLGASRRPEGPSRQGCVAEGRVRPRRLRDQGGQGARLHRQRQRHHLRRPSGRGDREIPRPHRRARCRRLDVAGLCV